MNLPTSKYQCAGHSQRSPLSAGLAGIVPQNTAGLGDVEKAERIYKKSEIAPIQRRFMTAVNNDPEIPERLHLNFDLSYTESTDKDAA